MERIQYTSILLIQLVFLLVLAGCDHSIGPAEVTEEAKTTQERYGIGATTAGTVDDLFFSHLTASAAASESASSLSAEMSSTSDEEFLKVVEVVPNFAGAWRQEDGQLVVAVAQTGQTTTESAKSTLRQNLQVKPELPIEHMFNRIALHVERGNFQVNEVEYNFGQLHRWRNAARETILTAPEVTYLDNNEKLNAIVIGITSLRHKAELEQKLLKAGVDTSALRFIERQPAELYTDSRWRPTFSGLRILFRNPVTGYEDGCTMGYNAVLTECSCIGRGCPPNSCTEHAGFFTNSHCTQRFETDDNTIFYQGPSRTSTNRVGVEFWEMGNAGQPSEYYGDVAFVKYDAGVGRAGRIANTEQWVTPCATCDDAQVNQSNPSTGVYAQYNSAPFVGDLLYKTGATTGETWGTVEGTCVDRNNNLCQVEVSSNQSYIAFYGDSGSPVYTDHNGNLWAEGILWGGDPNTGFRNFYFTPFRNFTMEGQVRDDGYSYWIDKEYD